MSLSISSYPNPYSTTPATDANAWIQFLGVDFASGQGRLQVGVNLDRASADAGLPTIDSFSIALGENFPSFAELMQDAEFATAFGTIRDILYTNLVSYPKLAGSTIS